MGKESCLFIIAIKELHYYMAENCKISFNFHSLYIVPYKSNANVSLIYIVLYICIYMSTSAPNSFYVKQQICTLL